MANLIRLQNRSGANSKEGHDQKVIYYHRKNSTFTVRYFPTNRARFH